MNAIQLVIVAIIIIGGYLLVKKAKKSSNTTTPTTTIEPDGCTIYTIYNSGKADSAYTYIDCTSGLRVSDYLGGQSESVLKCAKTGSLDVEGNILIMSKEEC